MSVHPNIVVIGSCMIDFVSYSSRLPKPGETLHGKEFVTNFGGKGANQCVAAAKLGGSTALVARVGDDEWGEKYIENLKNVNINTKYVNKTENSSTGIAQIIVSEAGENQIVIVSGANKRLSIGDIEEARELISSANVVVTQLETSEQIAIKSMQFCRGLSILNGAPALSKYSPELLKLPTIFCINEIEASTFTGTYVNSLNSAESAARSLLKQGCNSVLITLGSQGAVFIDSRDKKFCHIESPTVTCVDSTGAGDAFIGALAFLLTNNKTYSIEECIKIACIVASDSVTRPGTQRSFSGPEIFDFI